jgi:hypothetical protein
MRRRYIWAAAGKTSAIEGEGSGESVIFDKPSFCVIISVRSFDIMT